MAVPYTKGLSERSKNICSKMGIHVSFKGGNTTKPPGGPKDKDSIPQKSGVIYKYRCDRVKCDEEYIRGICKRPLEKNSRNIIGLLPLFMTIPTSKVIKLVWITSPLWVENDTASLGPSKRPSA